MLSSTYPHYTIIEIYCIWNWVLSQAMALSTCQG